MKNTNLSAQIFKRVMDCCPTGVHLWKHLGDPQRWQINPLLYINERLLEMAGPGFNQIGHTAGEIGKGFEATGFNEVFARSVTTGQPEEFLFHFGNENMKECDWHMYFVPLSKSYVGAFVTDITPQKDAERAKVEKVKRLEELNQKLVERELAMIQLKSEIGELEQKVGAKE